MKNNRRKPEPEPVEEGAAAWLLTYSDLVTQLLAFFVLLFSMSAVDAKKFDDVASSLRSSFMQMGSNGSFGTGAGDDFINATEGYSHEDTDEESQAGSKTDTEEGDTEDQSQTPGDADQIEYEEARKFNEFSDRLEQEIADLNLGEYVSVLDEKTLLILRLNSIILFDSGSADIRGSGKEILLKLSVMLKELDKGIIVQGHTDNRPINTLLFPSNWELSTKRATNIVLFLVKECGLDPARLTAQGNGEYKPIAPNDTEENMQKNRRIDIVIEK